MADGNEKKWYSPSICVTHDCNLNCTYCYQEHNCGEVMSPETAKKAIDWVFANVPSENDGVWINLIGGEPLLEFELIKYMYDYTKSKKDTIDYVFFASTNGTVLTDEMKEWFSAHRNDFVLGLSLDGTRETHNSNRSNSYDCIDFDFFLKNYPNQSVKMTLSQSSLKTLATDIISIHEKGFMHITGVNLAEGEIDWSDEKYLQELAGQLAEIETFYLNNPNIPLNQMLDRKLGICETTGQAKKWCGVGTSAHFIDTDGELYPCPFFTPMTFTKEELDEIKSLDFESEDSFVDEDCYDNCYIYPVCPSCYGTCYKKNKSLSKRDKSRCRIQKLITLFAADLLAKKMMADVSFVPENQVYSTITSIKKIRELYMKEFLFLFK